MVINLGLYEKEDDLYEVTISELTGLTYVKGIGATESRCFEELPECFTKYEEQGL